MTSTRTNENSSKATIGENKTENQLTSIAYGAKLFLEISRNIVLHPYGHIYPQIPHVYANRSLGHLNFNRELAETLKQAAATRPYGMATFWCGPFPMLYVVSNRLRHALVKESFVGVVDETSSKILNWVSGGNNVMSSFPAFRSVNSEAYKRQRRFLHNRYHGGAAQHLSQILNVSSRYLEDYAQKYGHKPRSLRSIITGIVLNTSSYLLGLTQYTLDKIYLENPDFQSAIEDVALYGISKSYEPEIETTLKKVFMAILKENFAKIKSDTEDDNLVRNIFFSLNIEFPETFEQISTIPDVDLHTIAMNFAATGLGAMVHSTTNTLDWAIARLLKEPNKMREFSKLASDNKGVDLSKQDVFEKSGALFPICEWILQNVFLKPPFSHEFFLTQKSFPARVIDDFIIEVPSCSYIIVNYIECNASNPAAVWKEKFADNLHNTSAVGSFVMNKNVASFGGSTLEQEKSVTTYLGTTTFPKNNDTRVCPGAMTSLFEQRILMTLMLQYLLVLVNSNEMSLEEDKSMFPLCVRKNIGEIYLMPKRAHILALNGLFNSIQRTTPSEDIKPSNIPTSYALGA